MHLADGCLMNKSSASRFDFGRIAHRYDAWYQIPRGAMYGRLEKRAIDRLLPPAPRGSRLLEIVCGTGHSSEYFCAKGFEVTGVDISEPKITIARQRRVARGVFDVADAAKLPFANDSFDVVAAITVVEFVADSTTVLSEMARCVKKPGGALIVGALNRLSAYNQSLQRRTASMYASANLFSPADLRDSLARFGQPTVLVAGFVPRWDSLLTLSPLLEWIGRLTSNDRGAFLATKVTL
jgi:ubiquinone/menaquinone biosynthesis C-methylase UbiE